MQKKTSLATRNLEAGKNRVYASVRFLKIGDINTKNQQFTAIVDLTFTWGMELLSEKVTNYAYLDRFLEQHKGEGPLGFHLSEEEMKQCEDFIPQLLITNLEDTKKERTVYSFSMQGSEIKFNMRWHLKGNFYEQMELYDFPFDVQDLCVRIDLGERSKDKFFLQAEDIPGILNDKSFQDEQEWDIFKMVQTGENNAQAEPDDEEPDGVLVLRCNVKRKFNYFLYNCFLVMLFFAVMSMCNFANKPENVQFRLAGTLTLVLTSVAYKLMLSNSLPTISYLTLVDVYVLFSVFMLTFLVVAFAVLHTVYRHFTCCLEEEELVHLAFRLDIITMAVLAGIHVMWNLSFGLYAFHKTRQVTDKLKEDEAIYAEKLSKSKQKKPSTTVTIEIPNEVSDPKTNLKSPNKLHNSNSIVSNHKSERGGNSVHPKSASDRERDREREGYRKLIAPDNKLNANSIHMRGDRDDDDRRGSSNSFITERGDRERDRDRDGRSRDWEINPHKTSSNSSPHNGGRSSQQHQKSDSSFRKYPSKRNMDKNQSVAIDLRGHSSDKRKKATFVSV